MVKKPAEHITLSVAEGEALIARVHQSNLGAADAGGVEWVIRMYFWVAFALQEAKLSVKRLRHIAPCGRTLQHQPLYQGPARCALDAYVPRLITCTSS
jgi:hypothetical protein